MPPLHCPWSSLRSSAQLATRYNAAHSISMTCVSALCICLLLPSACPLHMPFACSYTAGIHLCSCNAVTSVQSSHQASAVHTFGPKVLLFACTVQSLHLRHTSLHPQSWFVHALSSRNMQPCTCHLQESTVLCGAADADQHLSSVQRPMYAQAVATVAVPLTNLDPCVSASMHPPMFMANSLPDSHAT